MKNIQELALAINKFYLFNFILFLALITVVASSFVIQFKVENLQNRLEVGRSEIIEKQDKISMLEVEWAYLTRPSRIRSLASKFLSNEGYSVAAQIKTQQQMNEFYIANYKSEKRQEFAANF